MRLYLPLVLGAVLLSTSTARAGDDMSSPPAVDPARPRSPVSHVTWVPDPLPMAARPPRRSLPALITGIVMMSVGGAAAGAGGGVAAAASLSFVCIWDCHVDRTAVAAGTGVLIGGAVIMLAGIPLTIYGAQRVQPAWIGEPTATGWAWQF